MSCNRARVCAHYRRAHGGSDLPSRPYAPRGLGPGSHSTLCCGSFLTRPDFRVTAGAREKSQPKIVEESCPPIAETSSRTSDRGPASPSAEPPHVVVDQGLALEDPLGAGPSPGSLNT